MSSPTIVDAMSRSGAMSGKSKAIKRWSFPKGKKPKSSEPKPAKSARLLDLYARSK